MKVDIDIQSMAEYLRRMETAGFEVGRAAGQIGFRVAVGRDLFAGIAKLRALRWLWAKLIDACGVAEPPPPFVHAVSSDLSSARRDPSRR